MKTLKIYGVTATLIIIGFSIWIYSLKKELEETEDILQQCSDRYFKELNKLN